MTDEHRHYDEHDAGPEWGTPRWVVEPLSDAIGGFDLDPASGAEPIPYASERLTVEDNGLETEWWGDVWLNPPYGRSHNPVWAAKVSNEVENTDSITALVPASTSTDWWQNHYAHADVHCWIDTRISFHGSGDCSASFASVLCVFNNSPPSQLITALESLGTVTYSGCD